MISGYSLCRAFGDRMACTDEKDGSDAARATRLRVLISIVVLSITITASYEGHGFNVSIC